MRYPDLPDKSAWYSPGIPRCCRPDVMESPGGSAPLLRLELCAAARDSAAMAGPGAPCDPCAPAAVWKRHIVRQLRHRDRTQKALFLELVPACECVPGGSGMTGFEEVGLPARGEGLSRHSTCDSGQRRPHGSRGPCVLEPVTPLSALACLLFPALVLLSPKDSALPPLSILDTSSVSVMVLSSPSFRPSLGQGLVSPFGPRAQLKKAGVARTATVAERKERKSLVGSGTDRLYWRTFVEYLSA